MSGFSGYVQAGLQIGLDSILIRPKRGIYSARTAKGSTLDDIIAQATVEEQHHDELEITDHPVEQGAMITDHAYKRPAEVKLKLGWSNSPSSRGGLLNPLIGAAAANSSVVLAGANIYGIVQGVSGIQSAISGAGVTQIQAIYQKLLQLQEERALFVLYTGKRVYTNMVCKSLSTESDFRSENSLPITMVCKQIILVNSQLVQLSKSNQSNPKLTAGAVDKGTQNAKLSRIPEADLKARIASGELRVGE
jgi:hypothetical protein